MGYLRRSPAPAAAACALAFLAACGDESPTFTDAPPSPDASTADADLTDADMTNPRPGPVTALAATPSGIELDLAWQNPADTDLDAILVVASPGPVTFTPVDGTTYTVSQVVGTNQAVVNVGVATALADIPTIPGLGIHFAAWARDTAGQYSATPATVRGVNNALGAQTGMIQVFQDGTVTVTQQPRSFRLSGTAVYDDPTDAMTVQLAVENQAARVVFNLKGLVDSASQGTVTNAPFPATGGLPMAYYGPEAVAVGGAPVRQLDLTGIDGTVDPVVLTMHFIDAPAVIFGSEREAAQLADSAGSGNSSSIGMPFGGCPEGEARGGVLSADASHLVTGARSEPRLTRTDLSTLSAIESARLSTTFGVGSVVDVALSLDGRRVYAVLQDGFHANGGTQGECGGGVLLRGRGSALVRAATAPMWRIITPGGGPSGTVRLVELDAETLEEVRRVDLRQTDVGGVVELLAGNRAAVVTRFGEVTIVDLATFTLVDTDATESGVQPLELEANVYSVMTTNPTRTSFSVVAETENGYRVTTVDAATFATTSIDIAENEPGDVVGLHRTRDDKLYVLYQRESKGPVGVELVTIDGGQQSSTELRDSGGAEGFAFTSDETRYYVATTSDEILLFDRATHTELDSDGDASNGVTPLSVVNSMGPLQGPGSNVSTLGVAIVTPF